MHPLVRLRKGDGDFLRTKTLRLQTMECSPQLRHTAPVPGTQHFEQNKLDLPSLVQLIESGSPASELQLVIVSQQEREKSLRSMEED